MKNYKNGLIAFLWLIALVPLQAQWSVAHLSEPREDPYTVVAGSKILFVLGSVTNGSVGNKVDIYDTQTGLWTVHNLPFSGESLNPNPPVAAINELVFIVDEEDFTDLVQVYDANNNTWSTLTLSAPRKYASIGTAGEFVVFAGGVSESGQVSDKVDVFHVPTKVWHQATLSEPRGYIAITGLGNKIFMAGGYTNTGLSDRIDILNTDTWEASFTTLMRPRALIEAVTVGNKVVLAGGGEFDFVDYTEVDIFDGNTESWASANLTQVDFGGLMGSAVVGDKVYFEGGIGPDDAALMDVYDAAANTWSTIDLPTQHYLGGFTAAGGKLYLAGGVNDFMGVVEVYDCATGLWDTLGYLSIPRYWLGAAAAGNKLLLGGGYAGGYSNVVDIYTGISSSTAHPVKGLVQAPYPNPAQDQVHIILPPGASLLQVFDARGMLLRSEVVTDLPEKDLDVRDLPAGLYNIAVQTAGTVFWEKVVVE